MIRLFAIFLIIFLFSVSNSYAGGAVAKSRNAGQQKAQAQAQMKAQAQAQMQAQMQAQAKVHATQEIQMEGDILVPSEEVKDIVDLEDLVFSLAESSQAWNLIINSADKAAVVTAYIEDYKKQGIEIHQEPIVYAQLIDQMAQGDQAMLNLPFDKILEIVAVMEYDFSNGQDKDAMAKKVLGPQMYERNKQRIQARMQQQQQMQ